MWGQGEWDIVWVKRHTGRVAVLPGFEAPELLVRDLRECFRGMVGSGRVRGGLGGK
jgi:hypothetical protein